MFRFGIVESLKIKIIVAYDGTAYAGWQAQQNGVTVQQRVEEVMQELWPGAGRLHSSSRTDTGVHALGMVAHFEVPAAEFKMPATRVMPALNALLPDDIRVMAAGRCRANFHARFDATGKQYRYSVWNHATMNPLLRRQAWHVPGKLDFAAMRAAAKQLVGRHDFKSFAATRNYEPDSSTRTLTRCDFKRTGPLLTFTLEGDGFLYKMCRGIVGTMVQVGRGKFAVADIPGILASRDRRVAGVNAPAHGLVLWRVYYRRKWAGDHRQPVVAHEHRPA